MGQHLGSFGTVHDANDFTFDYFGETIRVHPEVTDVAMIELFATFKDESVEQSTTDVLDEVRSIGVTLIHPDDQDVFWRQVRANRQGLGDLVLLSQQVLAAMTGRPTRLPTASSDGQFSTTTSSTDGSVSEALHALDGRPDLKVAVLRAAG